MRGLAPPVAWLIVCAVVVLAGVTGCPPTPPPGRPDADAAPAPAHHATCAAAARHYAGACATSDEDTTADMCKQVYGNKPSYADCLMAAADCNAGTSCDNQAAVRHPPRPVVNGH